MWIAPMRQCTCGHKTFGATDETNRPLAKNYQVEKCLNEIGFKRDMFNDGFTKTIGIGKIIYVDMLYGNLDISITDINDNTIYLDFINTPDKLKKFLDLL